MAKSKKVGAKRRKKAGSKPAPKLFTHGGARPGAGRPRSSPWVSHTPRATQSRNLPVQVTLRAAHDLPSLRAHEIFRLIRSALADGRPRLGFRLVHYSVQDDHIRLLGEADSGPALSRGIQGLTIRIAKRLNAALERRGSIFRDRYDARALKTPLEVRRALLEVLNSYRRQCAEYGQTLPAGEVDPCSSALFFTDWASPPRTRDPHADLGSGVAEPRTALLQRGWRRLGALAIEEIPEGPSRTGRMEPDA